MNHDHSVARDHRTLYHIIVVSARSNPRNPEANIQHNHFYLLGRSDFLALKSIAPQVDALRAQQVWCSQIPALPSPSNLIARVTAEQHRSVIESESFRLLFEAGSAIDELAASA